MSDVEVPSSCTSCGVCCFSTLPEYIRVFGVDWDRMSERTRAFTEFIGNKVYMRSEAGHCAALAIDPGGALPFACGVYEERPDCCRALVRGSGSCRADLHAKQGRVDVEVARLVALRRAR